MDHKLLTLDLFFISLITRL